MKTSEFLPDVEMHRDFDSRRNYFFYAYDHLNGRYVTKKHRDPQAVADELVALGYDLDQVINLCVYCK